MNDLFLKKLDSLFVEVMEASLWHLILFS